MPRSSTRAAEPPAVGRIADHYCGTNGTSSVPALIAARACVDRGGGRVRHLRRELRVQRDVERALLDAVADELALEAAGGGLLDQSVEDRLHVPDDAGEHGLGPQLGHVADIAGGIAAPSPWRPRSSPASGPRRSRSSSRPRRCRPGPGPLPSPPRRRPSRRPRSPSGSPPGSPSSRRRASPRPWRGRPGCRSRRARRDGPTATRDRRGCPRDTRARRTAGRSRRRSRPSGRCRRPRRSWSPAPRRRPRTPHPGS